MPKTTLRKELTDSLIHIYSLDIVPFFSAFLHGEQAVLFALLNLEMTTPSEICASTGIAKNRMSAIINSLKKKNYIDSLPDASDKRKMNLVLTDAGKKVIMAKETQANLFFDYFIKAVGEKEVKEFIRIINLAVAKLGEKNDEAKLY